MVDSRARKYDCSLKLSGYYEAPSKGMHHANNRQGQQRAGSSPCIHVAEALPVTVQASSGCGCIARNPKCGAGGRTKAVQDSSRCPGRESPKPALGRLRGWKSSAEPLKPGSRSTMLVGRIARSSPDLTRHTSTAEVISGAFLRESLPAPTATLST